MAETAAVSIVDCLGWQLTDDNKTVLLGFHNESGQVFNLAIARGYFERSYPCPIACNVGISEAEDAKRGTVISTNRLVRSRRDRRW